MISNYKDKCGSCAKFIYCVMDGEIRKIGKCHREKGERIHLASSQKCCEYVQSKGGIRIETE